MLIVLLVPLKVKPSDLSLRKSCMDISLVSFLSTLMDPASLPILSVSLIAPLAELMLTLLPLPRPSEKEMTPSSFTSTLMALSAVVLSLKPFLV